MKRTLATTIALLLAAAVPHAAAAEELQFGWRSLVEYDSEVISRDGGLDDFIFTFGPTARLVGDHRRLSYSIEHFTGFEKYVDLSELDDFRHEVRGSVQYQVSPRIRFDLANNFVSQPRLRDTAGEADPTQTVEDDPTLNLDTGTVLTNVLSGTLTVAPTPKILATSQYSFVYREFDDPTLNAQNTISNTVVNQASYRFSEDHTFGTGFRYSNREFDTANTENNVTETYEAFATWNWAIDARSTFNARVGPAWTIDDPEEFGAPSTPAYPFAVIGAPFPEPTGFLRDPASCPAENARPALGGTLITNECLPLLAQDISIPINFITGDALATLRSLTNPAIDPVALTESDENDLNIFFSFSLDRSWDRFDILASWTRSDSQTDSLGATTVVDSLLLQSDYDITSRLRFSGAFRFARRFSDVERELQGIVVSNTLELIPELMAPAPGIFGAPTIATDSVDVGFKQTRDSYGLRFRLIRDWGRYSSAFIGVSWQRYEDDFDSKDDTLDLKRTTNSWQMQVGFTYRFEPIRF